MLNTLEIIDRIYGVLHTAGFTNIHKLEKPQDVSQSEYIVINALPTSSEILQECQINVNYYHADIDKSKRIMDETNLKTKTASIISTLDDYSDGDIDLELINQTIIKVEDQSEHYSNMRFIVIHIN